jgi:hypothetical protein
MQLLFIQKVLYWKPLPSLYLTTCFGLTGHLQGGLGKVATFAAMRGTALASGFVCGWFIPYCFVCGFAETNYLWFCNVIRYHGNICHRQTNSSHNKRSQKMHAACSTHIFSTLCLLFHASRPLHSSSG